MADHARPGREPARSKPAPTDVDRPDQQEGIVEIEPAAPIETGELLGAARGGAVSVGMAPMVHELEGAGDVQHEYRPAGGPEVSRDVMASSVMGWMQTDAHAEEIEQHGQASRPVGEQTVDVHIFIHYNSASNGRSGNSWLTRTAPCRIAERSQPWPVYPHKGIIS
jgi:hypothetical protein